MWHETQKLQSAKDKENVLLVNSRLHATTFAQCLIASHYCWFKQKGMDKADVVSRSENDQS